MEKSKKTKIVIGLSYFLLLSIFVIFFLSKFSIEEINFFVRWERGKFGSKNSVGGDAEGAPD